VAEEAAHLMATRKQTEEEKGVGVPIPLSQARPQ
jgi:hypothetical protein